MPHLLQLEARQNSAKTIYDTFEQGFSRALAQDGVPTPKGRIIQYADTVDWPTFPNIPIFMAVIFVASVMIGIGVIYGLEAGDKSFRTAEELEQTIRIPVLGITLAAGRSFRPFIRRRVPISEKILAEPTSAMSESVRLVRTAIASSGAERPPKVVMITSALPGEGKTTFSLMLARLSAQSGKQVLVIEAEMRRSAFGRELSTLPKKGLTEYLEGRATLDEVIGVDEASGAHFIAVRERSRFAGELLGSAKMTELLKQASADYDLVILDTPPATIVADAFELGHAVDAAVLVVKWGSTPRHMVVDATRKLRAANVPLVGIVMTQVDSKRYKSYGYGALPYEYAKAYYATR
jgi:succinoglycan biosynthesis transport protein ExoP